MRLIRWSQTSGRATQLAYEEVVQVRRVSVVPRPSVAVVEEVAHSSEREEVSGKVVRTARSRIRLELMRLPLSGLGAVEVLLSSCS